MGPGVRRDNVLREPLSTIPLCGKTYDAQTGRMTAAPACGLPLRSASGMIEANGK
jgi:hypothetical protein